MSITEIPDHLISDEYGIFRTSGTHNISYPEEGNQRSFQLEDSSFWFQHRNDCIISVIKRFPPPGVIVDIGGGNGFVTNRLIEEGLDSILLEPGPVGAFNAKLHRNIPHVICSTLEDTRFKKNSIAGVGIFDVLEHVEDHSLFISQIRSILEPGGLLYITVPAHKWLWSLSDITAQHFQRYDKKSLVNILSDSFDIMYFTYFFQALIFPLFCFRSIPYRLGLVKNKNIMKRDTEHGIEGGISVRIIKYLLMRELNVIQSGKSLSMGTSCLLAARKKHVI